MGVPVRGMAERTAGSRYAELDALRGLAACTVVLHHLAQAYAWEAPWYLRPLVDGHEAVVLFFTLSGFVLSLPFWNRGTSGPYAQYLVRRFFRIYVPFAAAIGVAAVGALVFAHTRLPLGAWFYKTWQVDVTPGLLGRQLMLWPGAELNTAFWSLRYEVQMSVVFPLLLLGLRRVRPWMAIAGSFAGIYLGWKLRLHAVNDAHFWQETVEYGSMFVAGAVLAGVRGQLREMWVGMPKAMRAVAAAGSAALYFGYWFPGAGHPDVYRPRDPLTAVGACGLILCCMYSGGLRRALLQAVPQYLGRVSFSLYLVHGTVLFAVLDSLYARLPLAELGVVYVGLAMAAAQVFCVMVEEPAMRWGKRLAMRRGQARAQSSTASDLTQSPQSEPSFAK